ncbi:MAG TPA: hypothetical protein VD969_02660 [Symbiobacteriaceae bacterium]|nr:hypothetical protein [Symbiobacteriaceae bacterium]
MKKGNPYRVLYWMGASVILLIVAVLVLIKLAPGKEGGPPPDPERTMIWLYDPADASAPAQVVLLEESPSQDTLSAVAFSAPDDLQQVFGGNHPRPAQDALATQVGRAVHHRVFLPYSLVATLIDAAQGIAADGRAMTGAEAIAYIRAGGDVGPNRAARVLLALADAVHRRGLEMSASEGFKLARQVETDIDLTLIPDVLSRWSQYGNPTVQAVPGQDLQTVQKLLAPDHP